MRYITVSLTVTDEGIQSKNQQRIQCGDDNLSRGQIWIDDTLVATQEAIEYVNLLDDGTAVGIARFRGDADRLATIEDNVPEILSCTVTGGETWLAYLHYEPDEVETALLERIDTEAISIDGAIFSSTEARQVAQQCTIRVFFTDIFTSVKTDADPNQLVIPEYLV